MLVKDRMSSNPTTITTIMPLSQAFEIMKSKKYSHLPVLNDSGEIVGIVTDKELWESAPTSASTLSEYVLKHLLGKMRVEDAMCKEVPIINENATIEEAALKMYNEDVKGLVVISDAQTINGIITESDMNKCLVDIMSLHEGRVRLTLKIPDRLGVINEITGIFKECGIDIANLVAYRADEQTCLLVVRIRLLNDRKLLESRLVEAGYIIESMIKIQD